MRRDPPPFEAPRAALEAACPHCSAHDAVLESLFGGSVSEIMLRCRSCHSIFHWVKWVEEPTHLDLAKERQP
jgi:uncharacterized Zn finger protein